MESSPLILAYDHARAASVATTTDTTVAINEHTLAAGEFARAASGSGNAEALRTLRLLEQHHQRLSELLRYPSENPPAAAAVDAEVQNNTEKPISTSAAVAELRASRSDLGLRSSSPLRSPPNLQHPRRLPPRDMSSSIASNLATARGIRANYTRQPLSPSVSAHQAPGTLESLPRRDSKRSKLPASIPEYLAPSWIPPTSAAQKSEVKVPEPLVEAPAASTADEGFSKFFESILSKLSAPLAFAGLPLISEEGPAPTVTESVVANKRRTAESKEKTGSEPDLTKYISRAALRATTNGGLSGHDSFYVVPTAGGTVSYAHILSFDQKEKRRLAASIHSENTEIFADPEEEDFVDARETPMPPSPSTSRRSFGRPITSHDVENKVEELEIENQSLKSCIDKLTNRLHAFEMSSQQNTFALQESMRIIRDSSPARPDIPGRGDETLKRRLMELEERVVLEGREIERLSKDNDRLKIVISRYRERWEKLKEGAKTRREVTAGKEMPGKDGPSNKGSDPAPGRFLAG